MISDAHQGLIDAIASTLPGAAWQRCRVHFVRNVLTKVPKATQSMVATLIRSIFEQPDHEQVLAQHARVVEQLAERFADAAEMLTGAEGDILAFSSFPKEHWRQIWSNNPQERLNKEIRRRTDVVGIFPNRCGRYPAGRCRPRRTARRVGRGPSIYGCRVPHQGPTARHGRDHRGGGPGRARRRQLEQHQQIDVVVVIHHASGRDPPTESPNWPRSLCLGRVREWSWVSVGVTAAWSLVSTAHFPGRG